MIRHVPSFSLVIQASILAGAIYLVGRHEADFNFPKLMLVAFGIAVVSLLVSIGVLIKFSDDEGNIPVYLDAAIRIPIVLILGGFLIHQFLYVLWRGSFAACAIYLAVDWGFNYLVGGLMS